MATHATTSLVVDSTGEGVFAAAEAYTQTYQSETSPSDSGHIAVIYFGGIKLQASGDGTRVLVAGLLTLIAKLEAARTEWLRQSAADRKAAE